MPELKEGQTLKNIAPEYGEKSTFQVAENEIRAVLAPAKAYVFEVDTPNIEEYYAGSVLVQNFDRHAEISCG